MQKSMRQFFSTVTILLFVINPAITLAGLSDDLKSEIQQKQTQIQELEKQIAQYKAMLKETKGQSATLKQQITKLETQIKRLETEIRVTQLKISETSLIIDGLASDISTKNVELEKQKNNLGEILRTINEYDQESPFELVLRNESFSDFLNQVQYIENLQNNIQQKVLDIKLLKAQLESQKSDFEAQKTALEDFRTQLRGKSLVLDDQKDEKEDLLTTTKNQEKKYQTLLTDLQKKRDQIEKEIYLLEDKLRLAIDPSSIPAARAGVLAWPIKDTVTQTYGPTSQTGFINPHYQFHNGIDIDAEVGDPIKAALGGTVSGVGNLGKYSYGKWITIKHENGLTTLYAHLSVQSVSVGQKITTGQIIGYAGNTGYSTGSHLHFTVYATNTFIIEQKWYGPLPLGGSINPMSYL